MKNARRIVPVLLVLVLGVPRFAAADVIYDVDLVFASNIADNTEYCHKGDAAGCDLWMATIAYNATTGEISVTDLNILQSSSTYGEWFPDLLVTAKAADENLVYYTKYFDAGATEELKNDVDALTVDTDTWTIDDLDFPGPAFTLDEAQFPSIAESGDFVIYTYLDGGVKNVRRSALDSNFEMTSNYVTYSISTALCEDKAADPVFIRNTDHSIIYHCPSGSDQGKLAQKTIRTIIDRTDNDVIGNCGHFSSTINKDWVACSSYGEVYYYDTTLDPVYRYLNTDNEDRLLISRDKNFYDDFYTPYEDCTDLVQAYTSFGDTSQWVLYSVICEGVDISKLFLVNADPSDPAANGEISSSDVLYISEAIEDYLDDNQGDFGLEYESTEIDALNFCTGDFDMYLGI